MFEQAVKSFRAHAIAEYPREACGVVIGGDFTALENVAEDPQESFEMDQRYTAGLQVSGTLQAVLHSHPGGNLWPSKRDMAQQMHTDVPWGICTVGALEGKANTTSEVLWWGDSVPTSPLIGRKFVHGVCDCYALVRDFYCSCFEIDLPVFPRDYEWWTQEGENLLEEGLHEAGFFEVPLSELRPGDGLMGKVLGKVSNHCGVYLGDNLMLHHLYDRVSRREPVTPWLKHLTKVVRHKDLKDRVLPTLRIQS